MTSLTRSQFNKKFEQSMLRAYMNFYSNSPVDTGFLRDHIMLIKTDDGYQITVDNVPYMEYTEEPWKKPRYGNPNQGWFKATVEETFNDIVEEMR